MRGKLIRKSAHRKKLCPTVRGVHLEMLKILQNFWAIYLKLVIRPCGRAFIKKRRARKDRSKLVIAVVFSMLQSLRLRVAAVKEHLRTLHIYSEQSLFWLHSSDPRAL